MGFRSRAAILNNIVGFCLRPLSVPGFLIPCLMVFDSGCLRFLCFLMVFGSEQTILMIWGSFCLRAFFVLVGSLAVRVADGPPWGGDRF